MNPRHLSGIFVALVLSTVAAWAQTAAPSLRAGSYWKCPAAFKPGAPRPMGLTIRLQPRLSWTQEDDNQPTWGPRDDRFDEDEYNTRRTRVTYSHQFSEDWLAFVHVRDDWGMNGFEFFDLYLTTSAWDAANITFGQMAVPFDRPYITSDVKLPLAERPLVSTLIAPQRQPGVLFHHQEMKSRLGWYLGAFAGNGANEWSSAGGVMPATRLEYVVAPKLSLGANWAYKDRAQSTPFQRLLKKNGSAYGLQALYDDRQVSENAWGMDLLYRDTGLNVYAGYSALEVDGPGTGVDADGWYVNFGKFISAGGHDDRLELVGGYEQFDPNSAVSDRLDVRIATVGLNYHFKDCEQMLRVNYVIRDEAESDVNNNTFLIEYDATFSL